MLFEAIDTLILKPFKFKQELIFTREGQTRSRWDLPDFFKELNISYHSQNPIKEDYFDLAKIDQEFVVDRTEENIICAKNTILK